MLNGYGCSPFRSKTGSWVKKKRFENHWANRLAGSARMHKTFELILHTLYPEKKILVRMQEKNLIKRKA